MPIIPTGKKELNELLLKRVEELLSLRSTDVKIQIDLHRGEVPTIRHDITEIVTDSGYGNTVKNERNDQ